MPDEAKQAPPGQMDLEIACKIVGKELREPQKVAAARRLVPKLDAGICGFVHQTVMIEA